MRHINSFFNFIRTYFGGNTCSLLKHCIKLLRLNIKLRLRILFLKKCISLDILPRHLQDLMSSSISFFTDSSIRKFRRCNYTFAKKVLKLELRDAYRHLHFTRNEIFRTVNSISKLLPISVASAFFGRQESNMNHFWFSQKHKMDNKI